MEGSNIPSYEAQVFLNGRRIRNVYALGSMPHTRVRFVYIPTSTYTILLFLF